MAPNGEQNGLLVNGNQNFVVAGQANFPGQNQPVANALELEYNSIMAAMKKPPFPQRMVALTVECKKLTNPMPNNEPEYMIRFKILDETHQLVQIFVREYLDKWKWSQIPKHGDDSAPEPLLTQILEWFHQLMNTIKLLEYPGNSQKIQKILGQLKRALLMNSVVVNQQPPRTIQQGSPFNTTVKFLDQKNSQMTRGGKEAEFKIFMINEALATQLYKSKKLLAPPFPKEMSSQNVLSSTNKMQQVVGTKFHKIQIKKETRVKKTGKGGVETMRLKFALLYLTTVDICGEEMNIWCVSRPFVFMTNAGQKCAAQATIFWDNYFRKEDGTATTVFETKENVNFEEFGRGLTLHFKAETKKAWSLTPDNLRYIGSKIFDDESFDAKTAMVNRESFCNQHKDKVNEWKWLYEIIKLIKKRLSDAWGKGAIVGFMDRPDTEELLRKKRRSTFLLRFSDTILGGLSVTSSVPGKGSSSMTPLTERDFMLQPLEVILSAHEKFRHNCKYLLHYDQRKGKFVPKLKEEILNIPKPETPAIPGSPEARTLKRGKMFTPYDNFTWTCHMDQWAGGSEDPQGDSESESEPESETEEETEAKDQADPMVVEPGDDDPIWNDIEFRFVDEFPDIMDSPETLGEMTASAMDLFEPDQLDKILITALDNMCAT